MIQTIQEKFMIDISEEMSGVQLFTHKKEEDIFILKPFLNL